MKVQRKHKTVSCAFLRQSIRQKQVKDKAEEYLSLLSHFYGQLIKEGINITKYNSFVMKDIEILMRLHIRMIRGEIERKKKEKEEKDKNEAARLLLALKQQSR